MRQAIKRVAIELFTVVLVCYFQCTLLLDRLFMLQIQYCPDKLFQIYSYLNHVRTVSASFLQKIYRTYDTTTIDDISHNDKILYASIITPNRKYDILHSFKTYLILNNQDDQTLFSLKKFILIYNFIITWNTPHILTIYYIHHDSIKYKAITLDKNAKMNIIKL